MFVPLRSSLVVLLAAGLGIVSAAPLAADPYVVQPGDTLSGLADRFGTTQAEILALNPQIGSPDLLFSGLEISVPGDDDTEAPVSQPSSASPAPEVRLTHVVQPGQTLEDLATLYQTSPAAILDLNPGLRSGGLIPGIVVVVVDTTGGAPAEAGPPEPEAAAPVAPSAPSPPATAPAPSAPVSSGPGGTANGGPRLGDQPVRLYTVVPGDTFSGIAARAGIGESLLAQLNPHVTPDLLYVGETLFVPRAESAPRPPSVTVVTGPTGVYEVVAGDSASAITERFGISFAALQEANRGLDLSIVFVGQQLRMPSGDPTKTEATRAPDSDVELTTYVVAPGDFAGGIADRHGLSLDELRRLNPSANLELIFAGQVLVVPRVDLPPPAPGTVPAGPAPGRTYTVQSGDTLTGIASQYGEGTSALTGLNPGLNPNLLSVGQTLRVPGTVPVPTVSSRFTLDFGDSIEYVAAVVGVTPHTLLANNPGLGTGYIGFGTVLRTPAREGVIIDVRAGDTLQAIARQFGTTVVALVATPNNGVVNPNALIAGQEILIPIKTPVFVWPAQGTLTDGFGVCRTGDCSVRHRGTDIAQNGGAVLAIADGVVIDTGGSYCCGLGFFLEIDHGNGWRSIYGHLNGPAWVAEGQQVSAGEPIAEVGTTGFSTGVHLHLELYHNDWLLDVLNYLP